MHWHLVCAARRSAVADAPARNGVRVWQYLLASTGGVAAPGRTRSAPITSGVRRASPCSG